MKRLFAPWTLLLALLILSACGGSSTRNATPALPNQLHATVTAADYTTVVQQLYVAYFGRPADSSGFANFKDRMATLNAPTEIQALASAYAGSADLRVVIDSFGASDESKALYSGDTSAFVTAIYQNLLSRAPDDEGKAYWAGKIDSGEMTRANASLSIMAGGLSNTTAQGLADGALIRNRITAASSFSAALVGAAATAYSGDTAAAAARAMLATITASTDAATIQARVDAAIAALTAPATTLYTPVPAIIQARCAGCHSAHPTIAGYSSAPLGITFDTTEEIKGNAGIIYQSAVQTRSMPFGNQTGMTTAERATIAAWVEGGAP